MTETMDMMQETSASEEVADILDDELDEEFDDMLDDLWNEDEDGTDEETSEVDDSSDADGEEEEAAAEENSEAETENEETAEQQADEQTSETEEMFPQELKVYGETKKVTMTEAKNLIQKGLAYDRAIEKSESRLQNALNDPRIGFVDELAKEAGLDAAEYMTKVRNQKQYASLIENFGSLENVPKDVLNMFTENAKAAKEKAAGELAREQEARMKQALEEEFDNFMVKHPEVGNIPDGVLQLKVQGESLEGAYGIWLAGQLKAENEKLSQEIKTLKQNIKNKQTALPSTQSKGTVEDDEDWFD